LSKVAPLSITYLPRMSTTSMINGSIAITDLLLAL
jgi:hypothetical protein